MAVTEEQAGIQLSVRELPAFLVLGAEETALLYPSSGGRPKARRRLTDHDETAAKLGLPLRHCSLRPMT